MGKATVEVQHGEVNRLLTDLCLVCGDKLIRDANGKFNEFHCCSTCTRRIEHARREVVKPHKKGAGSMCLRSDVSKLIPIPTELMGE